MCKPFACIRIETTPYLVVLDIAASTQPSHIDMMFPHLVDQVASRLERLAALMPQDQDLTESSFAKLPDGFELKPQLDDSDGAPIVQLSFDPSSYGSHNLRSDGPRLADLIKQSLVTMASEVGSTQ